MLDRLSLRDASLLTRETAAAPMHAGGVEIFGPELSFERVLSTLRARLGEVPLARKRVQTTGPIGGRPIWVDDPDFDLSYHLRHAALPAPGDAGQLGEYLARLLGRRLDRDRPLWEIYVVEGLEGDRRALFRKVHLAMAGADPFSVLLDEAPDVSVAGPGRWEPEPPPSPLRLTAEAVFDGVGLLAGAGREALRTATSPRRLASTAAGLASRLGGRADSPLSAQLTPHRRVAAVASDLDDFRAIRRAVGGSVHDAVVAVAADAVGRLLRWRGHDTTDLDLRVMVPVRVEQGDEVGVLAPLPVLRMDPLARLYRVMGEFAGLRESRQAVAAGTLVRLAGFAPPNLHAAAARLVSGEQRYDLALSNAPGPQSSRYLAGARMEASYPFLPLAGNSVLSLAVTSYAGGLYAGFVADRAAMPDLDLLTGFWTEALADLRAAAG